MITGGFGTTHDCQTGQFRRWHIGNDGVQRWTDTDEPVAAPDPLESLKNMVDMFERHIDGREALPSP